MRLNKNERRQFRLQGRVIRRINNKSEAIWVGQEIPVSLDNGENGKARVTQRYPDGKDKDAYVLMNVTYLSESTT